jgi:DNA end-binding protein Ku
MKTRSPRPAKKRPTEERKATSPGTWSGTISFGLVAIPVQLVKAVEPGRVSFRMLHSKDYSPLMRRMLCPNEGKIIAEDDIVRGYEIAPDKYIVITDEELASVSPERSRTIEIVSFVDIKDVDPIYYDHPFYLVPAKGGEKSYGLLAELMGRAGKAGLARVVLHEREYFVAIISSNGALAVVTLHYSDEIVPDAGIAPRQSHVDSADKNRVRQIIKEMSAKFAPDKYADGRRQKLLDLLKAKTKGKASVKAPEAAEEEQEGPPDLIAVLEKSMRKGKKGK